MKSNFYGLVMKDTSKGYIKTTRINLISKDCLIEEMLEMGVDDLEVNYFIDLVNEERLNGKVKFYTENLGANVEFTLKIK